MKADPTIEQFIQLTKFKLENSDISPIESEIEAAKILYPEMSEDDLGDLSIEEFRRMLDLNWLESALPLESFAIDGVIWKFKRREGTSEYSISIRAMQAISEAMSRDQIGYLPHVLRALYEPSERVENPLKVLMVAKLSWVMPFVYQIRNKYGSKSA